MSEKKVLQLFDRNGKVGVMYKGADESEPNTWIESVVRYDKPVIRSRKEIVAEQRRLLKLGIYFDDEAPKQFN